MFGRKTETDQQSRDGHDVADDRLQPTDDDNQVYPFGIKLALIISSIYIAMFLVSLVRVALSDYRSTVVHIS